MNKEEKEVWSGGVPKHKKHILIATRDFQCVSQQLF